MGGFGFKSRHKQPEPGPLASKGELDPKKRSPRFEDGEPNSNKRKIPRSGGKSVAGKKRLRLERKAEMEEEVLKQKLKNKVKAQSETDDEYEEGNEKEEEEEDQVEDKGLEEARD
ncbi:hypothetical protein BY996DRAFT_390757 [Phakopsora pachyrhizi]|nr:hypothetical protein BY996DRAFT_390757 [Phakopsora pachyrhizi]